MSAPDTLADPFDDLPATLEEAWAAVARGVHDRRSPFHTPALASTGLDGQPRLRVVVLRAFDQEARTLRVHTDRRSDKVAEIAREPRVAVLGYDAATKLQVRLEGRASLHLDDRVADAAWEGSRPMSRACYGTIPPSGSPIPAGAAFRLPADEAGRAAGRAHFAAVLIRVERLESLYLDHGGHRRARFVWEGDDLTATWLVP